MIENHIRKCKIQKVFCNHLKNRCTRVVRATLRVLPALGVGDWEKLPYFFNNRFAAST